MRPDGLLKGGPLARAQAWLSELEEDLPGDTTREARAAALEAWATRYPVTAADGSHVTFASVRSLIERSAQAEADESARQAAAEAGRRRNRLLLVIGGVSLLAAVAVAYAYMRAQNAESQQEIAAIDAQQKFNEARLAAQQTLASAAKASADRERALREQADGQKTEAQVASQRARAAELAAYASQLQNDNPTLALRLGWEAAQFGPPYPPGLQSALAKAIQGGNRGTFSYAAPVHALAWSPDGVALASGDLDGSVKVWEPLTGKVRLSQGGYGVVNGLAWSPDGNRLAIAGEEKVVVLAVSTGLDVRELSSTGAEDIAWSPDGKFVAIGQPDGTVRAFTVTDWKAIGTREGRTATNLIRLAWNPADNQTLAIAAGEDIAIWNVVTGNSAATLHEEKDVECVAWSRDGKLASAGDAATINLWNIETGKIVKTFSGHRDIVESIAWSPDGRFILSGSDDKTVKMWAVDKPDAAFRTLHGHQDYVYAVSWNPSQNLVASGSDDSSVKLWDANASAAIPILEGAGDESFLSVAWSPDGRQIATTSDRNGIVIRALATRREIRSLERPTSTPPSSRTAPTPSSGSLYFAWGPLAWVGNKIVSVVDSVVRTWNVSDGRMVPAVDKEKTRTFALSSDGRSLATAVDDVIKVRDVETSKVHDLPKMQETGSESAGKGTSHGPNQGFVPCERHRPEVLRWNPENKILAAGDTDCVVSVWNPNSDPRSFVGHKGGVTAIDWSPDGKLLASGSTDKTIRLWNPTNGRTVRTLQHDSEVQSLRFNPDGTLLAAGTMDGPIVFWDPHTGQQLFQVAIHAGVVNDLAWSPKGDVLASVGDDGLLVFWPGSMASLLAAAKDALRGVPMAPADCSRYMSGNSCSPIR